MYLTNISHNFPSLPQFRISRKQFPHKNLNQVSNSFDENLLRRLKSLALITNENPKITSSFLSLAVDILSSTHKEAETLFTDFKCSFDLQNHPLNFYLNDSIKLLDICNSISSEIENVIKNRLLISFVLDLLNSNGDCQVPSQEKLNRAKTSLSDWLNHTSKNHNLEKAEILINTLATRLDDPPPFGMVLTVKKLFHRIIYSVAAVTVLVAGVLVAAFSGSRISIRIRVPSEFVWAGAFNGLESSISIHNRKLCTCQKINRRFIDDLDNVDKCVRRVYDVIDNLAGRDRYVRESEEEKLVLLLSNAVKELRKEMTEFSDNLDGLSNGVNDLFDTVLGVREGLLEKIRWRLR